MCSQVLLISRAGNDRCCTIATPLNHHFDTVPFHQMLMKSDFQIGTKEIRSVSSSEGAVVSASKDADQAVAAKAWKWEDSSDSLTAYGVLFSLLVVGNVPALKSSDISDLPYFIGLAVTTVYIGAHRALTTTQRQQLSIKEGALAPVLASVSLFAVYLVVKYLPNINIQVSWSVNS